MLYALRDASRHAPRCGGAALARCTLHGEQVSYSESPALMLRPPTPSPSTRGTVNWIPTRPPNSWIQVPARGCMTMRKVLHALIEAEKRAVRGRTHLAAMLRP
jgi:hypothetical protein